RRAVALFWSGAAIGFIQTNSVNLHVRLLYEVTDVILPIPAMIIASIGYDEQRFPSVVCSSHLAYAQVHPVIKGSHSASANVPQEALNIVHTAGERAQELG